MATTRAGEQHPPTLLYLVKQVEVAVRARLDELLRPSGLTASQYTALTMLELDADLTSAQLARNSFVTAQSMADTVTTLERQRLITRRQDPNDRRRLVLGLTGDGRKLLRRYRARVAAVETEMTAGLSARQASELRKHLQACRAALAVPE